MEKKLKRQKLQMQSALKAQLKEKDAEHRSQLKQKEVEFMTKESGYQAALNDKDSHLKVCLYCSLCFVYLSLLLLTLHFRSLSLSLIDCKELSWCPA